MFKRKVIVALIVMSLFMLISKAFMSWFIFFPFLFFYGLPVSMIAEYISRDYKNSIVRTLSSMLIHVGAVAIFYSLDGGIRSITTLLCIAAFIFYIIDEVIRLLINKSWLYKKISVISPILFISLSVIWLILLISGFAN